MIENGFEHHISHIYTHIYMCIYMYVCMYVCLYVGMYVCMYLCMYVCMHVCMYGWMYVCMYVYIVRNRHTFPTLFTLFQATLDDNATRHFGGSSTLPLACRKRLLLCKFFHRFDFFMVAELLFPLW